MQIQKQSLLKKYQNYTHTISPLQINYTTVDLLQLSQDKQFFQKYYLENYAKNKINRLVQYYYNLQNEPYYTIQNSLLKRIKRQYLNNTHIQSIQNSKCSFKSKSSIFQFQQNVLDYSLLKDQNKKRQLNYIPFRKKKTENKLQGNILINKNNSRKYDQKWIQSKKFPTTPKTDTGSRKSSFAAYHKYFK